MSGKFSGATARGTKVVFAPSSAKVLGVFDPNTDSFRCGDVPHEFSGGAVVSRPRQATCIDYMCPSGHTQVSWSSSIDASTANCLCLHGGTGTGTGTGTGIGHHDIV